MAEAVLKRIAALTRVIATAEEERRAAVAEAKADGKTWQQIADALGITRQSAWVTYKDIAEGGDD